MSKAMEIFKNLNEEMDEDEILQELIKTFPDSEEEIRDSFNTEGRYGSSGLAGEFTADGTEYNWIASEEEANDIALRIVEQDLDSEPEIFNQDWLQGYITISDADKRMIASEEADSRLEDMSDDDVIEQAGMTDEYEEASDDEKSNMIDTAREKVRGDIEYEMESNLEDPIQYFVHDQGIYSIEDLMKANFISIDIAAAARGAVETDGWAHFLSLYDGNYETTENGIVYFREN